MNLSGKKILITGASSGLGRELSLLLAHEGADLMLVSNQEKELKELAKQCASARAYCIDLTHAEEIERLAKSVLEEKGYLDVLINCAGMIIPEHLEKVQVKDWDKVLALNLTAPFLLVKHLSEAMNKHSEAPLVVNVSSKSGKQGGPFCASYVASKFGLNGLTEAINEEYRIHGKLRAVSVCPGSMDTPVQDVLAGYPGIAPKRGVDPILDPRTSAKLIVDVIRYSDTIDISEIVFQARKNQVYKKEH